ncbi:hypothetical protein BS50DRAFT_446100, partial [Corynespora cassiicola Philippines]
APANNAIAHELHPLLFHEFDERYFGKPEDIDTHWHHLLQLHCIESLRRTLMCKADSSLYAGYWIAADGSWPSKELRSNSQQV